MTVKTRPRRTIHSYRRLETLTKEGIFTQTSEGFDSERDGDGLITRKELDGIIDRLHKVTDTITELHGGMMPFSYVAKTTAHTVDEEAKRHFTCAVEPVLLDANHTKLTGKTLPRELIDKDIAENEGKMTANQNVYPILLHETNSDHSVLLVEACAQKTLGLKHGNLWQGFGFGGGGGSTPSGKKGTFQVWLFVYPNLLGLIENGTLNLNPNCFLTLHSEGPGPIPTTIDGIKEAMTVKTRPRRTIHSYHQLEMLKQNGTFTYTYEGIEDEGWDHPVTAPTRNLNRVLLGVTSANRKTKNGGYKALDKTKQRISAANKGNVPHNKGKPRSAAEKNAISGGMKLRNEQIIVFGLLAVGALNRKQYTALIRRIKSVRQNLTRNPTNAKKQIEYDEAVALRDRILEAGRAAYHAEELLS